MFRRTENFQTYLRLFPAVSVISGLQIGIWLIMKLPFPIFTLLFALFSGYNAAIWSGEYWRIITPIFLHTSFSHLLMNTITFAIFAPPLEKMLTSFRFVIAYLLIGMIANIASLLIMPVDYIHVGASGAIFGLFGLHLYYFFHQKAYTVRKNAETILIIMVIALFFTFHHSNVNIVSHLAGLASGFLLAFIFSRKKQQFIHYTFYNQPKQKRKIKLLLKKYWLWVFVLMFLTAALLYAL